MPEPEEIKKQIGSFSFKYKTIFNKAKSDSIILEVSLNEDLKNLLKDCVINEKEILSFGDYALKRYKVKKWVFNSINYINDKGLLFLVDFVDDGEAKFFFDNVSELDTVISIFKDGFKALIQIILRYKNISGTIVYNIN